MITTNMYGGKIASFGHGTVRITSAFINSKGVLALDSHTVPQKIGSSLPNTVHEKEAIKSILDGPITLEFGDVKALELVILKLQEVRAMMLDIDLYELEEWKLANNLCDLYYPNPKIDGGEPLKED